ncbi:hypothetical protein LTR62_005737 [Meristemomyces frigidus]|uniref:Uncharacterized protein n=1 Tax=Meristemomyces frigidus TaxID=1508187 RepID=A0AAN7TD63_9PEZI|nr:hypothetical protein LTR62_005737 [Meristemomyces frigidus]
MANTSTSSLDPLTLPSSPLGARSTNRQMSIEPRSARSNQPSHSPAKSFIVDTGEAGDASPWRIKVTVQAEPRDGSPAKRKAARRTTRVPLKTGKAMDESTESDLVPQRKRKATPVRRRTTRLQAVVVEPATTEEDRELMPPQTSSATKARRRRSLLGMSAQPTQRGKRLSLAREELNVALQEAVGYSDGEEDEYAAVGDVTLAGEEDFTMVSIDTLQSMKADTSVLSRTGGNGDGDRSGLSVSYLPSSPPKAMDGSEMKGVRYPDLTGEMEAIRKTPARAAYDAMSWQPTGHAFMPQPQTHEETPLSESPDWQKAQAILNERMEDTSHSTAVDTEDHTKAGADEQPDAAIEPEHENEEEDADLWQEEASRSLEEDSAELHRPRPRPARRNRIAETAPTNLNDLFAAQPLKPPRAKIPRTWRRSSGADFAYSDSPAHLPPTDEEVVGEGGVVQQKGRRDHSTGGESRASSGMLTPTSTDDDEVEVVRGSGGDVEEEPGEGDEGGRDMEDQALAIENGNDDVDFTRVDGEGTMFEARTEQQTDHDMQYFDEDEAEDKDAQSDEPRLPDPERRNRNEGSSAEKVHDDIVSPLSDASSSSVTSPDGDDTGLFWENNLPSLFLQRQSQGPRPALRKRAMDLTELLARGQCEDSSEGAVSVQKTTQEFSKQPHNGMDSKRSPLHMRPVHGRIKSSPSDTGRPTGVSSPLRKSLLRSSKVLGGDVAGSSHVQMSSVRESSSVSMVRRQDIEDVEESWQSKASDQRQLLQEMRRPLQTRSRSLQGDEGDDDDEECDDEDEYDEDEMEDEPDHEASCSQSFSEDHSTQETNHEPNQSYEEHLNLDSPQKIRVKFGESLNSSLLAPRKVYSPLFGPTREEQDPGPASPPIIALVPAQPPRPTTEQPGLFTRLTTTVWSAIVAPTIAEQPPTPSTLSSRLALRARYGVLPASHPWTIAHMRTLHRMLNSLTSGKIDTIIPHTAGPTSPDLMGYINKPQKSVSGYRFVFTADHAKVVQAFRQVLVPAEVVRGMREGEVEMLGDGTARSYRGLLGDRHGDDLVWGPVIGVEKGGIGMRFLVGAVGDVVRANESSGK